MHPFSYTVARDTADAIRAHAGAPGARFIAGGTTLVDLMKLAVETPAHLVDISRLPLTAIEPRDGGVRIGALASNTAVAEHPVVRARYPLIAQSILLGATQQIRNVATVGGNLLQRTRCLYFRDPSFP